MDPLSSFHPIFFNTWARDQLSLEPYFTPLTFDQVKKFFMLIRKNKKKPPFHLPGLKEIFIDFFMTEEIKTGGEEMTLFTETLSLLWGGFVDEYASVGTKDLDARFSRYLLIREG